VPDRLLTSAQAAERWNTTERWVRRAIFEKRIPYVKIGRLVRIQESVVDGLIAANRVEARSAMRPREVLTEIAATAGGQS
jgi:excisionase family DNA binding protein